MYGSDGCKSTPQVFSNAILVLVIRTTETLANVMFEQVLIQLVRGESRVIVEHECTHLSMPKIVYSPVVQSFDDRSRGAVRKREDPGTVSAGVYET